MESKREKFEPESVKSQAEVPNSNKETQWNGVSHHILRKCIVPFCSLYVFILPSQKSTQLPGHTLCFQQEESQETFQFLCLPVQWIYISLINKTSKMLSPEPHESHRFLEQLRIPLHFE